MSHPPITPTVRETIGELASDFVRYTEEILFGDVWRSEALTLRDRSLITVAALVAGEHTQQLPYHLGLAKENGLTEAELFDVITHLAFYVGWPRAASALQVGKTVFQSESDH
ncbi:gamma-carboxymuconolactone decarboxylase [Paenibacillus pectinilyticus]|uniref:Gamma-carboxymuconolactone decarboxylase n=1 Tax=Paenibacillus pectinilyticus TaxID=512399 RepID=A0A1C1A5W1_9BACL|nr:carboxymuconolactone decarboxylase family protein [Paenibacillus pectinilyticus]OCT15943.1 gamma-carboxymuconolactone decarboxylase [Paenibacillus pectinilyticus]